MADGVMLVTRWRKTPAGAAELAAPPAGRSGADVRGAAMTMVDLRAQVRAGGCDDEMVYYNQFKARHQTQAKAPVAETGARIPTAGRRARPRRAPARSPDRSPGRRRCGAGSEVHIHANAPVDEPLRRAVQRVAPHGQPGIDVFAVR
ncbi:hypothetical protein AB5I41_17255 [Sphingomonas sp. MMS24-JH45]